MSEWWFLGAMGFCAVVFAASMTYPLLRNKTLSGLAFVLLIPAIVLAYMQWGSYSSWSLHLENERSKKLAQALLKTVKGPQEIIDKMRAHLKKDPKSAKGWFLLGRVYANVQDNENALKSFKTAYDLEPSDEQYAVHYAHALWTENQQQFSPQIKAIFQHLLKQNPNQPDALAMLAMEAYQTKNFELAIEHWQKLLALAPAQSEEARAIRKAIAKAQSEIHG